MGKSFEITFNIYTSGLLEFNDFGTRASKKYKSKKNKYCNFAYQKAFNLKF